MEKSIRGKWLTAHFITDGIWRISDNGKDNMYLIVGEEKAMAIDTGYGVENLASFVRKITPLPTVTAITHGHLDHALGNDAFDTVYAGAEDMKNYSDKNAAAMRSYLEESEMMEGMVEKPKYEGSGTHAKKEDLPLADGMVFDLGGRQVRAFLTPGHTAGSACFLDDRSRVLFTGDSFVPTDVWGPVWMHIKSATTLQVFYDGMSKMNAAGGFDYMLSGHGEGGLVPAARMQVFLDGVKGILEGREQGKPEHTFAGDGLKCVWDGTGVIYDPERLV